MNKRGYEFSFTWIFAILVGAVVIFIAVYASIKFVNTGSFQQGSEAGKEIGILLTPFETGIESGKTSLITTREETTIYNDCVLSGEFGEQRISAQVDPRAGESAVGAKSSFKNRYFFSEDSITGKEFYVLSKPFDFPYKIGDIIISWSDKEKYCFVDLTAFPEIKEEVKNLNLINIENVSSIRECSAGSKKVCFRGSSEECDLIVEKNLQKVNYRDGSEVYYDSLNNNALLYAAIFSDPEIYDCQIKRLMKRSSNIAGLYIKKSQFLESRGCGAPRLNSYFGVYLNRIGSVANSQNPNIKDAEESAEELRRENDLLSCELF